MVQGAAGEGIGLHITSGFRSTQRQGELYTAWVRAGKPGNPVARPGKSSHESGQSIDAATHSLTRSQKEKLGAVAKEAGLPWAGAKDPVHFGAGFGVPMSAALQAENNANPSPTATIIGAPGQNIQVDGGTTTIELHRAEVPSRLNIPVSPLIDREKAPNP